MDCMNGDVDNHDRMMMDVMNSVDKDDEKKKIMMKVLVKIQDSGDGVVDDDDDVDYDGDNGYYMDVNNLVAEDNLGVLIVKKHGVVLMVEMVLQLHLQKKVIVLVVQILE